MFHASFSIPSLNQRLCGKSCTCGNPPCPPPNPNQRLCGQSRTSMGLLLPSQTSAWHQGKDHVLQSHLRSHLTHPGAEQGSHLIHWIFCTLNISQCRFQLASCLEQHSLIPIRIATGEHFACGHVATFLPVAAHCYPHTIHGFGGVSEHRDYTASGQMERGS